MMNVHAMKQTMKAAVVTLGLMLPFTSFAGPVNVNTATAEAISAELKGVGEKRASAIVIYREKHGDFKGLEDLEQVKGIGKSIVSANAENIVFK